MALCLCSLEPGAASPGVRAQARQGVQQGLRPGLSHLLCEAVCPFLIPPRPPWHLSENKTTEVRFESSRLVARVPLPASEPLRWRGVGGLLPLLGAPQVHPALLRWRRDGSWPGQGFLCSRSCTNSAVPATAPALDRSGYLGLPRLRGGPGVSCSGVWLQGLSLEPLSLLETARGSWVEAQRRRPSISRTKHLPPPPRREPGGW